jgi:hypothetical protein
MKWIAMGLLLKTGVRIAFTLLMLNATRFAQEWTLISRETPFYKAASQFSGITARGDTLFLLQERCKKIDLINEITHHEIGEIDLSQLVGGELEGLTIYKNHLLIVNEVVDNPCVYDYNLNTRQLSKILISPDDLLKNDFKERGIEGIAVLSTANGDFCYLLKEKNGNHESIIRQMKIKETNGVIGMEHIRNTTISHPGWRYSDLCLGPQGDRLYCLKTKYRGYKVEVIKLNIATGLTDRTAYNGSGSNLLYADLSNEINHYGGEHNTNLEGLVIYNHKMYIISDNVMSDSVACEDLGNKKTLFVSVAFH